MVSEIYSESTRTYNVENFSEGTPRSLMVNLGLKLLTFYLLIATVIKNEDELASKSHNFHCELKRSKSPFCQ